MLWQRWYILSSKVRGFHLILIIFGSNRNPPTSSSRLIDKDDANNVTYSFNSWNTHWYFRDNGINNIWRREMWQSWPLEKKEQQVMKILCFLATCFAFFCCDCVLSWTGGKKQVTLRKCCSMKTILDYKHDCVENEGDTHLEFGEEVLKKIYDTSKRNGWVTKYNS